MSTDVSVPDRFEVREPLAKTEGNVDSDESAQLFRRQQRQDHRRRTSQGRSLK